MHDRTETSNMHSNNVKLEAMVVNFSKTKEIVLLHLLQHQSYQT